MLGIERERALSFEEQTIKNDIIQGMIEADEVPTEEDYVVKSIPLEYED